MVVCCCLGEEENVRGRPQRACTDCPCFCLFLLCAIAQAGILAYGIENGDLMRYVGLPDGSGQFCGVSSAVYDKPYLYFCKSHDGHFNWTAPICVNACPEGNSAPPTGLLSPQLRCPGGLKANEDYATYVYSGSLCLPTDREHLDDMAKFLWDSPTIKWLMELAEMEKAWQILVISALVAIMLGFVYLFVLEHAAYVLLWVSIGICVIVPASLGTHYILGSQMGGLDGLVGTGDAGTDFIVGIGLCTLSFLFSCLVCCKVRDLGLAVECIKATCECIRDMPTLLFEPIVTLTFKVPLLAGLIAGGMLLCSCVTEMHRHVKSSIGEVDFMETVFTPDVQVFIAFYVIISLWIFEFCTGLSQFAVAYATQQWWFAHNQGSLTGKPQHSPSFAACTGLRIGIFRHVGTIALGSLVISFARVPRIILRVLLPNPESKNPVSKLGVKVCSCCVGCFENFLRYLNKNAYMDVAINGSSFCHAAQRACMVLQSEASAVAVLNGATWLFEITGVCSIALCASQITYWMCTTWPVYAESSGEHYIQDPIFLAGVSFVIGIFAALPFMLVIDQVSDTILFCFATESDALPGKIHSPLTNGGKDDCRMPETQALLQRVGSTGPQGTTEREDRTRLGALPNY